MTTLFISYAVSDKALFANLINKFTHLDDTTVITSEDYEDITEGIFKSDFLLIFLSSNFQNDDLTKQITTALRENIRYLTIQFGDCQSLHFSAIDYHFDLPITREIEDKIISLYLNRRYNNVKGEDKQSLANNNFFTLRPETTTNIKVLAEPRKEKEKQVRFLVVRPALIKREVPFIVDIWACVQEKTEEVYNIIYDEYKTTPDINSSGIVRLLQGDELVTELSCKDLIIDETNERFLWDGEIGKASFIVKLPIKVMSTFIKAKINIQVNDQDKANILFLINAEAAQVKIPLKIEKYGNAFISYAKKDKEIVFETMEIVKKYYPGINFFYDTEEFRKSKKWRRQIFHMIPNFDLFYLFWSKEAKECPYVKMEWRCAYKTKGIDFIIPVPIDPPNVTELPKEFKNLYDLTVLYNRFKYFNP